MNLAKITVIGKIIEKPESRTTQEGKEVAILSVSTSNEVSLKVYCWGNMSSNAFALAIGDYILISGNLSIFTQADPNSQYGKKLYQIQARDIQKLALAPSNIVSANMVNSTMSPKTTTRDMNSPDADLAGVFGQADDNLPF